MINVLRFEVTLKLVEEDVGVLEVVLPRGSLSERLVVIVVPITGIGIFCIRRVVSCVYSYRRGIKTRSLITCIIK